MSKLMEALGEDGLDEFAQEHLRALASEDDEDSDEEDAGDGEEGATRDEEDGKDAEAGHSSDHAIPVDDLPEGYELDEDAVLQQKVRLTTKCIAMERIRSTIALDPALPWTETLSVTYPETINVDVDDDLNRELAFYKQALHGAQAARALAQKHSFPFTRPSDYFAEMVKSDAHMERIRQRLLDDRAGMRRSEEKRKEREGKKFGKQVQMERIKERQQNKKEVEERLKGLKRKRKGNLDGGNEDFDVAVEDALADRPNKRSKSGPGTGKGPGGKPKLPRGARDKKFGFGGSGKRSKQNTKDSTDSFVQRGGPGGKGKGGKGKGPAKRPGKGRRMAQRSRT
ncbi:eukaryotic rRNA processing [Epithele typhae]|uniref:eukaryotic rRNA processing n=1 Tax=Epithele typhae TaxID=378194 RepID=UPI002008CE19|nr:eukaryotic rRNA processing [Epithele typhae]KAH9924331.1 eukaryotic rRNA processing [Epithele typhae]